MLIISLLWDASPDNVLITHELDTWKTFHSDKDKTNKRKQWPSYHNNEVSIPVKTVFTATEGKHYQKIDIPLVRLVIKKFAIPSYFPYILYSHYLFSLSSSVCLLLQCVALFQAGN